MILFRGWIICLCCCISITVFSQNIVNFNKSENEFQVNYTNKNISINGILSEWKESNELFFAGKSYFGQAINSAFVKALWNEEKLFLSFRVIDTKLNAIQIENVIDVWRDDAVEIYISTAPHKAPENVLSRNEYQFLVNINNNQFTIRGNDQLTEVDSNKNHNWKADFYSAISKIGTINNNSDIDSSYIVEIGINWSTINYKPKKGDTLLVDFAVDDFDSVPEFSYFDWSNLSFYSQPAKWSRIILTGSANENVAHSNTAIQPWYISYKKTILIIICVFVLMSLLFIIVFNKYKNKKRETIDYKEDTVRITEPVIENESSSIETVSYNLNYKQKKVELVKEIISKKYSENITIDKVAGELALSVRQLQRILKEVTTKTFTEMVNDYRLDKSVELLSNPDFSIAEIGYKTGFENQSHFRSLFKKRFGKSPSDYRKTS